MPLSMSTVGLQPSEIKDELFALDSMISSSRPTIDPNSRTDLDLDADFNLSANSRIDMLVPLPI